MKEKINQYVYGFTSPRKPTHVFQGSADITMDDNVNAGIIMKELLKCAVNDMKKTFEEENFKDTDINFTFISFVNTICVK